MMRRRIGVRPSRAASVVTALVGAGMLAVFVPLFFGASHTLPGPGGPSQANPASAFFVLWVIALGGLILYHAVNALTDKAPPVQIIDVETAEGAGPPPFAGSASVAAQLRELEQLRREDLISPAEYDQKRRAVLDALGTGGPSAA